MEEFIDAQINVNSETQKAMELLETKIDLLDKKIDTLKSLIDIYNLRFENNETAITALFEAVKVKN